MFARIESVLDATVVHDSVTGGKPMRKAARAHIAVLLSAFFAAAACQSPPPAPTPVVERPQPKPRPAVLGPKPEACGPQFVDLHREYALPPTVAPIAEGGKGQPLQWAIGHPVDKPLGAISSWRTLSGGWSSLGLRLTTANASGVAVRLSGVGLPEQAEIWLCSPDGSQRRGPLRAGPDGQLYTPVVTGAEAWLEVLSPTRGVPKTTLTLVEVYGGFR
jgi:hypothetical protein